MDSDKKVLRKVGNKIKRIVKGDVSTIQDETTRLLLEHTLEHVHEMLLSASEELNGDSKNKNEDGDGNADTTER